MLSKRKLVFMPTLDNGVKDFFTSHNYDVSVKHDDMWNADLTVFTGGEDVSPFLYGEKRHNTTHCNIERDMYENNVFRMLWGDQPKVGICRGAQFLNVMSGGSMYQDVDNHTRSHDLFDPLTKETVMVTSTHHQMMCSSDNGITLAHARLSTYKQTDCNKFTCSNDTKDEEVVWYDHTQSLCFQPHPEYEYTTQECRDYFWSLLFRQFGTKVLTDEAMSGKGVVSSVA